MSAELIDIIFCLFSTKKTGSGIGLSLCKQTGRCLHKGNIHKTVDHAGSGQRFSFLYNFSFGLHHWFRNDGPGFYVHRPDFAAIGWVRVHRRGFCSQEPVFAAIGRTRAKQRRCIFSSAGDMAGHLGVLRQAYWQRGWAPKNKAAFCTTLRPMYPAAHRS